VAPRPEPSAPIDQQAVAVDAQRAPSPSLDARTSPSRARTSSSSSAVQASQRSSTSRYRGSPGRSAALPVFCTWASSTSRLRRDDRLRDRGGRKWTLRGAAYLDPDAGEYRAVLVSGAEVLIERERFCDSYMLLVGA
jgi:hypothetical protein